jgi:hypothetical protein
MTTYNIPFLPIFTTLLGTTGIASGTYQLLQPLKAEDLFGLLVPRSITSDTSDPEARALVESSSRARGLRNLTNGAALVLITGFWQFSNLCRVSPTAATAVKKVMGLSFLTGTLVALGDGLIVQRYAASEGVRGAEEREKIDKTARGHWFGAGVIVAIAAGCLLT